MVAQPRAHGGASTRRRAESRARTPGFAPNAGAARAPGFAPKRGRAAYFGMLKVVFTDWGEPFHDFVFERWRRPFTQSPVGVPA